MKSLFIIRTPFQLFNCIEAQGVFKDVGECYLLCIYKKDIDRSLMERMIESKSWKSVFFLQLTTFNRLCYPLIVKRFLTNIKGARYCFFGLTTPLISHCINTVEAEKNILLDDGNEIFLIAKKISNESIFYIGTLQRIYYMILGRKVDFSYAKDMSIFSFFDLKEYKLDNVVLYNDYHVFKQKVLALPIAKEVFFIGSNLIDTYMDKAFFEENMLKIVNYYKEYKVIYILHRYEDKVYLESLGDKLGFEVIQFSMILEMALLEYGKIPEKIATFRSTALETLGYLYAPIAMEVFELDTERLLKPTQKDEYVSLYSNYRKKNIPIVNLNEKSLKRVGLIITNLAGSGAEKVTLHMARMFKSKDIDVHIFLLENVITYNDINDLQIHFLSKKRNIYKALKNFGDILLASKLKRMVEKIELDGRKFDLFLSNLPAADRVALRARLPHCKYVIHTSYSMEVNEFMQRGKINRALKKEKLYHALYEGKDVIAVSEGIKNDLDKMGIGYRSCEVIYNPFDIEAIRELGGEETVHEIEGEYLLSASAFRPVKRHDILLEAYSKLIDPPPLKLLCNPDPRLEKMINELGIHDQVEILGFTKNPYPVIKNAKLLILSSEREGLPTVLVEALILGTAVVSTDCISGPSEILTGDLSAYLSKVNDPDDLSSKISLAIDHYPEIKKSHIEKFSMDTIYEKYDT